jgi:hypothetical protein
MLLAFRALGILSFAGAADDLFRFGVGLLDCLKHRLRVGALSHGLGFLIYLVVNERIIAT